jgi:hypothetical protein
VKFIKKKIIYGCDSRGDGESAYLTRLTVIETRLGAIYLHKFHRSDDVDQHDHPWGFVSVILWRGYFEETAWPVEREAEPMDWHRWHDLIDIRMKRPFTSKESAEFQVFEEVVDRLDAIEGKPQPRKRVWPGMVLLRKATHRHRVVLIDDKPAYSLVIRGPYVRQWGFFTSKGWQQWREYFKERGC